MHPIAVKDIINNATNSDSIKSYLKTLNNSNNTFIECSSSLLPLLSKLIHKSSGSDVLIISSTENHGNEIVNWINNLTNKFDETILFPQKKKPENNSLEKQIFK